MLAAALSNTVTFADNRLCTLHVCVFLKINNVSYIQIYKQEQKQHKYRDMTLMAFFVSVPTIHNTANFCDTMW